VRSGFAAVVGVPNVGKSSLINRLVGHKVNIVSPRPQTTRDRIRAIAHWKDLETQVVFLDTPGVIVPKMPLEEYMVANIKGALEGVELILFVIDGSLGFGPKDKKAWEKFRGAAAKTIVIINKSDLIKNKNELLSVMDILHRETDVTDIFPVSALKGDQIEHLRRFMALSLPEGPPYFPEDMLTDKDKSYMIEEMVRETIIYHVFDELPYSVAIVAEEMNEKYIRIAIICERESQKGILIGKRGAMIRTVGKESRRKIEEFLGRQVFLDIGVKVIKNWRKDSRALRRLGYYG